MQLHITMFDIFNNANARLDVRAEGITAEGFTAVMQTWADAHIYHLGLTWTALLK